MTDDDIETLVIDFYPWAAPTAELRRMFDALPAEEKRRLVAEALCEGDASGTSDKSPADILAEVLARPLP